MKPLITVPLAAVSLFACGEIKTTIDEALRQRIETVRDCFPPLFAKAQALLRIAESWKLQSTLPDPPGMTWAERLDGAVDVRYRTGGATIDLLMHFYSPSGDLQDLDLSRATSLHHAVALAAVQLQDRFGADQKFIVGSWTIGGAATNGAGVLTGILGGTASEPQLEELRTTTATPDGGPPPIADGTITIVAATTCTMTFRTDGLRTDTTADQLHPIGALDLTIVGPQASVSGTATFDGSSIATIVIDDLSGVFTYDSESGKVTYTG